MSTLRFGKRQSKARKGSAGANEGSAYFQENSSDWCKSNCAPLQVQAWCSKFARFQILHVTYSYDMCDGTVFPTSTMLVQVFSAVRDRYEIEFHP
jgi:hypothetical protein